ncbi:MAG: hypothetical protein FJ291_12365 [Planctomycetes bacterium]|nr:hypothetical protein [Planctomycetota bacterium]
METFDCPHCGRRFYWHAANVGKTLLCHVCGQKVEVPPQPSDAPADEAAEEAEPASLAQEAATAAALADPNPLGSACKRVLACAVTHRGKVIASLLFAFVLYAWFGRIAPVRRELQAAQAAMRRATRVGDLELDVPFLFWTAPRCVGARGTASVTHGAAAGMTYVASPPYRVRLTCGLILTPFGASVVFSGRVAGEYDRPTRSLTLAGDLTAPTGSVVRFELTTERVVP